MHLGHNHSHHQESLEVATVSIWASLGLTIIKTLTGLLTGSMSILAESIHSLLDLIASIITFFAVKLSNRPADREHHFGHGKFENISALIEVLLLWGSCFWILFECYNRLVHGEVHIIINFWSFAVLIISIIVDLNRASALERTGKKNDSLALLADALHFKNDAYMSLVALCGIIMVHFGWHLADIIAAIIIVIATIIMSWQLVKDCIDQLVDKAPADIEANIKGILADIDYIQELRTLRIRKAGANIFVDIIIGIDGKKTLYETHKMTDEIEDLILAKYPTASIMIHPEP